MQEVVCVLAFALSAVPGGNAQDDVEGALSPQAMNPRNGSESLDVSGETEGGEQARPPADNDDAHHGNAAAIQGSGRDELLTSVLPNPSPWLFTANAMVATSYAMEAHNLDAGTWNIGVWLLRGIGLFTIPASFLIGMEPIDPAEFRATTLTTRTYLLDFKKKSALTGSLKREPEGLGVGWDFALEQMREGSGLTYGGALTYQQTGIDQNDWADINSIFLKLDATVGWNVAHAMGRLIDSSWLERQVLEAKVGPSYFRNYAVLSDEGSAFNSPLNEQIGASGTMVSAWGYEVAFKAAVDFWGFGGVSASFERGSYPALSFPASNADGAALLVLAGFDDLRAGSEYTWQRVRAEISIPFVGALRSGTLDVSGTLTSYENDAGTSVNNRGLALGSSWRF